MRAAFSWFALALATPAYADSLVFSGLGFPGDGATPSMLDYLGSMEIQRSSASNLGSADPKGGFGYGVGLEGPPALLAPSVSLSYASDAGDGSVLARGWTLDVGMTVSALSERERLGDYAGLDLYRASGLPGLLEAVPADTWQSSGFDVLHYVLVSDQPVVADAWLYTETGEWIVHQDGVETLLEPRLAAWRANPQASDIRSWRPVQQEDASGNRITWEWGASVGGVTNPDLLTRIVYGDNFHSAAYPPTGRYTFLYEARDHIRYSASEGPVEVVDARLVQVQVEAAKISGSDWVLDWHYALTWTTEAEETALAAVDRVGHAGTTEPVARFTYGDFDLAWEEDGQGLPLETEAPYTLGGKPLPGYPDANDPWPGGPLGGGYAFSHSETIATPEGCLPEGCDHHVTTWSDNFTMLADADADGLTDLLGIWRLDAVPSELRFLRQWWDGSWSDQDGSGATYTTDHAFLGEATLDSRDGKSLREGELVNFASRLLTDVDGDGLVDLVLATSTWEDADYESGSGSGYQTGVSPSAHVWSVRYGAPDGTFDAFPTSLDAPFAFPSLTFRQSDLCTVGVTFGTTFFAARTGSGDTVGHDDAVIELRDMNGDGWVDVVFHERNAALEVGATAPGSGLQVFLHTGNRLDGWSLTPIDWLGSDPDLIAAVEAPWEVSQVSPHWIEDVVDEILGTGAADVTQGCVFSHVMTVRELTDLNADGLTDLVVAEQGDWEVFLGTEGGFAPDALTWTAPGHAGTSITVETTAQAPFLPPATPILWVDWLPPAGGQGISNHAAGRFQPEVDWSAALQASTLSGPITSFSYSSLEQSLMDLDGDGRADLVEAAWDPVTETGALHWWRNLGDGFSDDLCATGVCDDVPELAQGLHLTANVHHQFPVFSGTSRSDALTVRDLNQDGALDRVDFETGTVLWGAYRTPGRLVAVENGYGAETFVRYQPASSVYPVGDPDVLQPDYDNQRQDLVASLETWDRCLDDGALTRFEYDTRICSPGTGCWGFEAREELTYALRLHPWDASGQFAWDTHQGEPLWYLTSAVHTDYTPTRDRLQVDATTTTFDADHHTIPELLPTVSLSPGSEAPYRIEPPLTTRYEVSQSWEDLDTGSPCTAPAPGEAPRRCRMVQKQATDHGEDGSGPKTATLTVTHQSAGLPEIITETEWGGEQRQTVITWVQSVHGDRWLPAGKQVYGADPFTGGASVLLQSQAWYYDGSVQWLNPPSQGHLTRQQVCAGPVGQASCSDVLEWDFDVHTRGMVQSAFGPLGQTFYTTVFRFGGVYPGRRYDAEGLEVKLYVDAHGRPWKSIDPGGVQTLTEYDDLGRPVLEALKGIAGSSVTHSTTSYATLSSAGACVPRLQTTTTWDGTGGVVAESASVLGAFGTPLQTWTTAPDGQGYLVSDALTDVFGQVRFTTHPHRRNTLPTALTQVGAAVGPDVLTVQQYDAFGVERIRYDDQTGLPGCVTATWPEGPGELLTVDPTRFPIRRTTDSFGRLVKVEEGFESGGKPFACADQASATVIHASTTRTTGTYTRDGLGRLASFRDGSTAYPVVTHYQVDQAGRLRFVQREDTTGARSPYYAYDYDGGYPIRMYEGASTGAAPLSVSTWTLSGTTRCAGTLVDPQQTLTPDDVHQVSAWTYDDAGRVTRQLVRDAEDWRSWDCYETKWDTLWDGLRSWSTDPTGAVKWRYDDVAPGAGKLGRVSSVERLFESPTVPGTVDPTVGSLLATQSADLAGNVVDHTLPGGTTVVTVPGPLGLPLYHTVYDPTGATEVLVAVSYGDDGLATGREAVDGVGTMLHGVSVTRRSPGVIDDLSWRAYEGTQQATGGSVYGLHQDWRDGLLPAGRTLGGQLSTLLGVTTLTYDYDELSRVSSIALDGVEREVFTYTDALGQADPQGTPSRVQRVSSGGTSLDWSYTRGEHGLITRRDEAGGVYSEEYDHDPVTGRVSELSRYTGLTRTEHVAYGYDGMGQLGLLTKETGSGTEVVRYHRDGDALTRRDGADGMEYWFGGWQLDRTGGSSREVERPLSMLELRMEGGAVSRRWVFRQPDGQALVTLTDAGVVESASLLGAFGTALETVGSPSEWDGYQGMERDPTEGMTRMGARHMLHRDGMWLQPEPLLHLGPLVEQQANPRTMTGVYAGGMPSMYSDRSGYSAQTGGQEFFKSLMERDLREVYPQHQGATISQEEFKRQSRLEGGCNGMGSPSPAIAKAETAIVEAGTNAPPPTQAQVEVAIEKTLTIHDRWLQFVEWLGLNPSSSSGGLCFVRGTEVMTAAGARPVEEMRANDLTLAASTDPAWEALERVEVVPLSVKATWLNRACDRVRRAAQTMVLPTALLAACDVGVPPEPDEIVEVYEARTGTWFEEQAGEVSVGGELLHGGHLFRVDESGLVDLGTVDTGALADAGGVVTEVDVVVEPDCASWVLVLADDDTEVRHAKLADVEPGGRVAFQGRVYETFGEDRVESVMGTGEVLGRVVDGFVRSAPETVNVRIAFVDGPEDVLTGTPNHPFWVPSVQDYVELKDLEVGTVLQTYGGAEATVLGLTWKPGEVEVYDIEVEGLHNFFVRGPGSDAPGVLVHNSTGGRFASSVADDLLGSADDFKRAIGNDEFIRVNKALGGDLSVHTLSDATRGAAARFYDLAADRLATRAGDLDPILRAYNRHRASFLRGETSVSPGTFNNFRETIYDATK
ncbi:MAG: hypothetical protein H6734_24490 [Alphaproteobacteria bacterium]|nr:hypothetical protein [Alphaproteobacteria bacterium]